MSALKPDQDAQGNPTQDEDGQQRYQRVQHQKPICRTCTVVNAEPAEALHLPTEDGGAGRLTARREGGRNPSQRNLEFDGISPCPG